MCGNSGQTQRFHLAAGWCYHFPQYIRCKRRNQAYSLRWKELQRKKHCRDFSHTNAHLPSFLIPMHNIKLTATGHIPTQKKPKGERPLAAVHRQGMVVASQPSSHHPLGTGIKLVLGGVSSSSCFFPDGVLGLASTLCQHGKALAEAAASSKHCHMYFCILP